MSHTSKAKYQPDWKELMDGTRLVERGREKVERVMSRKGHHDDTTSALHRAYLKCLETEIAIIAARRLAEGHSRKPPKETA